MYLVDFVFDNVRLSDLDYMVGSSVTSVNDSSSVAKVSFNTIKNYGNHLTEIINSNYEDVITVTFDIIKYTCDSPDGYITDNEISYMTRWLCRNEYLKFQPIYNDTSFYQTYFMGTFTEMNVIRDGALATGFTLTFTANAPWGFMDFNNNKFKLERNYEPVVFYDESDELGDKYPEKITIKITDIIDDTTLELVLGTEYIAEVPDGNTSYYHGVYNYKTTIINNCVKNEIITLDCIHKVITSNVNHPRLYNDFNYVYPKFTNSMNSRKNVIASSLPCEINVEYKPIKKVGVIV